MTVGERIRNRRIELGMSVDDVAKRLGKNRATVYRYENGFIEDMPTSVLESIARVLSTTPADLMGWPQNAPEPSEPPQTVKYTLTAREAEIMAKWRDLGDDDRDVVETTINAMLEKKTQRMEDNLDVG